MDQSSDRSWPLPSRTHAMRMRWHDLLFAHWPVDPQTVNRLLPGIRCETFDGQAWLGVVPFRMSDVAPRFVPAIPSLSAFPELNVRTYVNLDGKPGVWFFSLDSPNRIANRIARTFFHLPYMDASIQIQKTGNHHHYQSRRYHRGEASAELDIRYEPGEAPFLAKPGTLEFWLTARYCLYAADRKGNIYRGEIDHPPWRLAKANCEITTNTMLDWLGLEPRAAEPHALFAEDLEVKAWLNQPVTKSTKSRDNMG